MPKTAKQRKPASSKSAAHIVPETGGRFLEDFKEGDIYRHWPGRTVTETDNIWFTNITMNANPLHFDANYCARTEFGQLLVNSAFTLALVVGMTVRDTSMNAVANLGWEHIRMPAPVFVGDTLYAESEILAVRKSRTRPNQGIVTCRQIGRNQDGTVVLESQRAFLIASRAHSTAGKMRTPAAKA